MMGSMQVVPNIFRFSVWIAMFWVVALLLGCADTTHATSQVPPSDAVLGVENSLGEPPQATGVSDDKLLAGKSLSDSPIPLSPPVMHANLPIATQLVASGQFADAEIVLRAILKESPDCARAQFLLGVALSKQKRYDKARALLEASLASNQDFVGRKQVDHFLAWACYYLGDLEAAKRCFQSHIQAVPEADDSYYGLGVIALDEDRTTDAQVAFERSMELIGTDARHARDRAKALARLGDLDIRRDQVDHALALYEESSRLWPDHYEVWGKLARVYESMNRPQDAIAARAQQQAAMERTGRAPAQEPKQ